MDIAARSGAAAAVQAVVRDHQVARAAADIYGGQRDAFAVRLVGAREHVEEFFGMPGEVLVEFRVQVDQLSARRLVPFHADLRRGGGGLDHLVRAVRRFFAHVPAQALPHQAHGLMHALLQDAALSLRHAWRHRQDDVLQLARRA
ncbi:hypothetical protein D3C87_1319230 [compost metagenome]